ncbi:MAG: PAS domain S-box protein [Polyangia bacterium]
MSGGEAQRAWIERLRALARVTRTFAEATEVQPLLECVAHDVEALVGGPCLIELGTAAFRTASDRKSNAETSQVLVVELRAHGLGIGALTLRRSGAESSPFDDDDTWMAQQLADHAALALESLAARERSHVAYEELAHARRVLFDENPSPMIVCDVDSLECLAVNAAAQRLYGYTSEELAAMPVSRLCPIARRAGLRGYLAEVADRDISGVVVHERKDGTHFDVEYLSHPLSFAGRAARLSVLRDVSDRNQLAALQARLAAVVSSSDDAILSKNMDGIVTTWNPGAEKLFGYSAEEMVGRSIGVLIPPDRKDEERYILATLASGRHIDHYETVRRCKDGRALHVSVTISPIRDSTGKVIGASKVARDIGERIRLAEEETRSAELDLENRRIQAQSRLKSEFLANMSHELRTPLNAIIGFAALMHAGKAGPLAAIHVEYLGDILTSARHLLQLINDVLDLAKIEAGHLELHVERVDLPKLVSEVKDILRGLAAERRVRLVVELDPGLSIVSVDARMLKQVLYNYLSNAIKFTPEHGEVRLRVRREADDAFRIEVEDTGIGIRPEDLDKLFIEFQQLDATPSKRFGGTGLGLALTKRLVEAHGGHVGVTSELGVGSTFFAVLHGR